MVVVLVVELLGNIIHLDRWRSNYGYLENRFAVVGMERGIEHFRPEIDHRRHVERRNSNNL